METIALLALAFLISGGQLNEENVQYVTSNEEAVQELYNPSETRLSDIIHTDLAVRFDWEKQHLHGTAEITAKPYFKPTNELVLDAKGFDIHSVKIGEEDKPQQIWTQGETEASSCWFPTIDKPNERMTQNIAITVQDKYTTLSNGLLVKSQRTMMEQERTFGNKHWGIPPI